MSSVSIFSGVNIQAAIDANPAGTVFQLAAGIYRGESFQAKTGDQFIGDPSGGTVLDGAIVLNNWAASGGYWVQSGLGAPLTGRVISGSNPLSSQLNDLFIDNVLYARVASLAQLAAGTWYFDPSTDAAYISDNPTGRTVEYSVTPNLTSEASGATDVVMQNMTIEKYATDAQIGAVHGVVGWKLINITSTQNHGAGVNIGANTTIQGGNYSGNGQIGIEGTDANGAQVLNATINDNNYAGYNTQWDAGGLKMSTSANVIISGNKIDGNNGQGIWGDIDSSHWTISNNTVTNNTGNGIMYEISHAATGITGNGIGNNGGAGIYISNSDGVSASGNRIIVKASNLPGSNGAAGAGGIDIINDVRGSGPGGLYRSVNDTIAYNTIVQQGGTSQNGIFVYQNFATDKPSDIFDDNTYYVTTLATPLWHFNDTDYTFANLQRSHTFESGGTEILGVPAALLQLPSATPPTPTGRVVTTGAGSDTLRLDMSEDAYKGDAAFTVSVDGQQLGGTFTASASHAAHGSDSMILAGNWGAGSHTVSVNFVNDLYGGSPSADRNLYVDDIVYDAVDTGQSAAMFTNQSRDFTVLDTTPTVITVPGSQANVSVGVNGAIISAGSGDHLFLISGNACTFNFSGGTETVRDSGRGGNTFTLPPAGLGSAIFNAATMTNGDSFNLRAALAATQWDGSASTLQSYLHISLTNGNTELWVSLTPAVHSAEMLLATFEGQKFGLSAILSHAIT